MKINFGVNMKIHGKSTLKKWTLTYVYRHMRNHTVICYKHKNFNTKFRCIIEIIIRPTPMLKDLDDSLYYTYLKIKKNKKT